MKLEIDLSNIFNNGTNSVNENVRAEIVEVATEKMADLFGSHYKDLTKKIHEDLAKLASDRISKFLDEEIPKLMDYEYEEVTSWGEKKGKYTVRSRLLKEIDNQMVFKESTYSSDRNAFTKAVKESVEERVSSFRRDFNKEVDKKFTLEALDYAEKKLKERLGIK
jgi:hypothetical protein